MKRLISEKYIDQLLCSPELADDFIKWFIWNTVDSFGTVSSYEIGPIVSQNYDVNVSGVKEYVRANLKRVHGSEYGLKDEQVGILKKVRAFSSNMQAFGSDNGSGAFVTIKNAFLGGSDPELVCAAISRLDQLATGRKDIDYQILFFNYLQNIENNRKSLEEAISGIIPENSRVPLQILFFSQTILTALSFGDIRNLESLLQTNHDILTDIFFLYGDEVVEVFKGLSKPSVEILHESVEEYLSTLDKKGGNHRYCFEKRYGIGLGREKGKTLEEIGQAISLSRERARQLIAQSEEMLKPYSSRIMTFGAIALHNRFGEYRLLNTNEAILAIPDLVDLQVFSVAAEIYSDKRIAYKEELDVFYEPYAMSIHDLKFQVLDGLDDLLSPEEFGSKREFEKRIILTEYSLRDCGYYIRKGKSTSLMITRMVDRFFPSGYHVGEGQKEDFSDLCKCLRQAYGENYPLPESAYAVEALLQREGYCLIDRGVYINRAGIIEPDIPFTMAIIDYLDANGPTVYYDSIFEKFKDEFEQIGVRNVFHAKGVIDFYLHGYGFHTKRNYVMVGESKKTAREVMLEFMREQAEPFTIQELRNRFPGVKDYIFFFAMDDNPDILIVDFGKYISAGKCGITERGRQIIKEELEAALKNNEVTTSHKVFGRIQLFHADELGELGHLKSHHAIVSYAQYDEELKNIYDSRRPYLARKGSAELSADALLYNHLKTLSEVTIKDCQLYRETLGLNSGNFSFIGLIVSLCDDFVLVDRYTAVRRDTLDPAPEQLSKIRSTLLQIIRLHGEYRSADSASLSYFPEVFCGREMNAYYLLGIINTFLQDAFIAETDAAGTTVNYTIKEVR